MCCRTRARAVLFMCWVVLPVVAPQALGDSKVAEAPCRLLIVTGFDKHHDWQLTTPVLRQLLQQDPRLKVDILNDLARLASTDLAPFSVVIIHFKNADPKVPGREAFDQLRQFVKQGGGLVLVHFACGAFEEFKQEYAEMAGRVWFGLKPPPGRRQHDPRGPFVVNIAATKHPITAGMADFETDDELYTCLEGDAPITVVATATSKNDGQSYPMAMVREYGKGRVFNCTLGHDERALETKAVGELYRRGCAWAAGLTPVPPAQQVLIDQSK